MRPQPKAKWRRDDATHAWTLTAPIGYRLGKDLHEFVYDFDLWSARDAHENAQIRLIAEGGLTPCTDPDCDWCYGTGGCQVRPNLADFDLRPWGEVAEGEVVWLPEDVAQGLYETYGSVHSATENGVAAVWDYAADDVVEVVADPDELVLVRARLGERILR